MYKYMTPQEVWNNQKELVRRPMAYAYWARWDDSRRYSTEIYAYRFKTLWYVSPGPHAYTLRFIDGTREELTTYDTVCVYYVELAKSA